MPVRVGHGDTWQVIEPTTDWKLMPLTLPRDQFTVATDRYYVNVEMRP